jgi:hypothetical protein
VGRVEEEEHMHLTPPERETVVTMNDEDDHMVIWTAQRPMITRLKANPDATLVDEGFHGTSAWACFHAPKNLLTVRRRRVLTSEQRDAAIERGRRLAQRTT